jgi:hypothetical protein
MSFLSWITVAGIALGFGATDAVAVSSDSQAKKVSNILLPASLIGIGATSLLLLESYWINVAIACANYGLVFWNLGLVRRRNPVLFEQISNFQMLTMWCIYLTLLSLETSDCRILTLLFALMNALIVFIAFKPRSMRVLSEDKTLNNSMYKVSLSKLVWEINYSSLTRLPFLMPAVSGTMHSAFSYGYLLFEMASAMLSHFQSVFLKSRVPSTRAWIYLCACLLAINTASVVAMLIALNFQNFIIEVITDLVGLQLKLSTNSLMRDEIILLIMFMLAITTFQCAAFGRYAIKLEANTRIVSIASAITVIVYAISWAFSTGYSFSLFTPFCAMLLAGLLMVSLILRIALDEFQFISKRH